MITSTPLESAKTRSRAKIGVVGAGRWGKNLIRVFSMLADCEVVAVCDTDPAKRTACGAPTAALHEDLGQMLGECDLDAVVISTPPAYHARQAIAALRAGKHVFVEKPMALSLDDASRMREASREARRCLMVGHLMRYHPAVLALHQLVSGGGIGAVRKIVALRLGPATASRDQNSWWSLAPHDVSLVRYLFNEEVLEVSAMREPHADLGDDVKARLRLANGTAELWTSTAMPHKQRRLIVEGTERTVVFDDGASTPVLAVSDRPAPAETLSFTRSSALRSVMEEPTGEEPLSCEARHFIAAIGAGTSATTDADEGCRVVAVLEAGAASITQGGQWTLVAHANASRPSGGARKEAAERDRSWRITRAF